MSMQLMNSSQQQACSDSDIIARYLPLHQSLWLELGCGTAMTTRHLAENYPDVRIIATEVDQIQHAKNLLIDDLPSVSFRLGGAQAIDAGDASFDAVIMLKSLHHVPPDLLEQSFSEIARVLKPGGLAYFSEPVFAGDFNEILRLFNDEQTVREAAFAAISKAADSELFELVEEIHCSTTRRFAGFAEFEQRILGATHSNFDVDDNLLEQIKARFNRHLDTLGFAEFQNPIRIDILRRQ